MNLITKINVATKRKSALFYYKFTKHPSPTSIKLDKIASFISKSRIHTLLVLFFALKP